MRLTSLLKEILCEWRGATSGDWVDSMGKSYDVGDRTHWEWADDYLKNQEKRFKDDPKEEMLARGWLRVMYDANNYLIHIESQKMTKKQKEFLEDASESTRWAVMDDEGSIFYEPFSCNTPEETMKQSAYLQQEDHGMGYSHNVSLPQDTNTMNKPTITKI